VAVVLALWPSAALADGAAWEEWQPIPGVFDADGPRTDGSLLIAGSAALYLLDADGKLTPFARGPGGYRDDPGAEAYVAVSRGGHVSSAGCDFTPDETFILRLHVPFGITRVTADGADSGSFANITGVTALGGIAIDTGGAFDQRLLVTGTTTAKKTAVFAIDCNGAVTAVTRAAPAVEGGIAVAPSGFGQFGGDLIAPDEYTGRIYAISPAGKATMIARPALPVGADVGVESVGFVPQGLLSRGGWVYYADRFTKGNRHPGTDHLLRLSSSALDAAGVREGDMLVAFEGGATLIAIRCDATCGVTAVVRTPTRAHGEGHLAFTVNPPRAASPTPVALAAARPLVPPGTVDFAGQWGVAIVVVIAAASFGLAVGAQAVRRRPK
jgi:hypothetical protein